MATAGERAPEERREERGPLQAPGSMLGAAAAEVVGTFLFVFFGTATVVELGLIASQQQIPPAGLVFFGDAAIGLAFGFGILIAVYAFGHVSGAHVNPAVTIGLAAARKFPMGAVPVYIVAQLVGAILAALAVYVIFADTAADQPLILGATQPGEGIGDGIALIAEFIITFILVVVIMATATDDRASPPAVGLAVGLTVAAAVFATLAVSGGSLNPARTLGPMIVAWDFPAWWVYIVGPVAGGVVGALAYDLVMRRGSPPEVPGTVEERPKQSEPTGEHQPT